MVAVSGLLAMALVSTYCVVGSRGGIHGTMVVTTNYDGVLVVPFLSDRCNDDGC
jgi:hypothetical protein